MEYGIPLGTAHLGGCGVPAPVTSTEVWKFTHLNPDFRKA
jgi:hypothetical protein